jgi:hypothetical protein
MLNTSGVSDIRNVQAIFTDSTGPTMTTPTVVHSTTVDRQVTINWAANETLMSASCSVDGAAFVACTTTSSHTVTVAEGSHTFKVKGADVSGNVGPETAPASFRVVDTALVSGPGDFSNSTAPTFVFSSLVGTEFDCAVDAPPTTSCGPKGANGQGTKTFSGLTDGTHTFRVRAKDGADSDRVPLVRTWTVDTVPPTVTFVVGKGPNENALQSSATETFGLTASEQSTFSCRLDGAAFAPCSAQPTVTGLRNGLHRFEVRAIDRAGNTSPSIVRSWTVAGLPTSDPKLGVKAKAGDRTTKIRSLKVQGLVAGTTVQLTCKGKGCPKALTGPGATLTATSDTVDLRKLVKKPLKAKTKLTIRVDDNGDVTVFTVKVRSGKKPSVSGG